MSTSKVVVLDDDISIHRVWAERFGTIHGFNKKQLIHLSTPSALRDWIACSTPADAFFLLDYEFLSHEETGLDLILELGLLDRSALVSSYFEDENVLQKCRISKVRLIPKAVATIIPIAIANAGDQKLAF